MSRGRAPRPPRGRRKRPAQGDTWIKGQHAVAAILRHTPDRVLTLHCWGKRDHRESLEIASRSGVKTQRDPPSPELAEDHLAQGIAATVRPFGYASLDEIAPDDGAPKLLLVLDSITDPRNLGAILRSAAFFGVDAVIVPKDRACPVNPAVERISRGATAIVPVVRVTNIARAITTLRDRDFLTAATVLSDTAVPLTKFEFQPRTALVLGGEGRGARRLVVQRCELALTLPALGEMQSLNVASFATLLMAAARGLGTSNSA